MTDRRNTSGHRTMRVAAVAIALLGLACPFGPPIAEAPEEPDLPPVVGGIQPEQTLVRVVQPDRLRFALREVKDPNPNDEILIEFRIIIEGGILTVPGTPRPLELSPNQEDDGLTRYADESFEFDPCLAILEDEDDVSVRIRLIDSIPESQRQTLHRDGRDSYIIEQIWDVIIDPDGDCEIQ